VGLPDTLSELCDITAASIETALGSSRYRFDEEDWHRPTPRLTYVSYSGCLMAMELLCPQERHAAPCDFPLDEEKLHAVEAAKVGLLRQAVRRLGGTPNGLANCEPAPDEPSEAPAWFRRVAADLRKHKL